jgi:hypothetical protein
MKKLGIILTRSSRIKVTKCIVRQVLSAYPERYMPQYLWQFVPGLEGRLMASTSKCLAQSNKSHRAGRATKKRH